MVQPSERRLRPLLVPVALVLSALMAAAVLLVRQGSLLVHQCVPGDGTAGWLGLRLALLRADGACPDGALAVGGDGRQVIGVVVMVTLPVLVAHLAGAGLGLGLLARLRVAVRHAAALLGSVAPHLPEPSEVTVPRVRLALTDTVAPVVATVLAGTWSRRGPPRVCAV